MADRRWEAGDPRHPIPNPPTSTLSASMFSTRRFGDGEIKIKEIKRARAELIGAPTAERLGRYTLSELAEMSVRHKNAPLHVAVNSVRVMLLTQSGSAEGSALFRKRTTAVATPLMTAGQWP